MRLQAVYDLYVSDHIVLARELFVAYGAGIVLDVGLVRGDVMPTEVADVGVGAMAYRAPVHVALFHAEIPDRALGALGLAATGVTATSAAATA